MGKRDRKNENVIPMRVRVRVQNRSSVVNSMVKLGAPDTENMSKQQLNNTQGAATHRRLLSKKTR